MAFDQTTRNRLQKFVSESRGILTEEFTRQLQAIYGLDPKNGTAAPVDTLNFLDNKGRQTAVMLRQTLAHYVAATPGKSEKARTITQQALDRIIREQAFTVLNRLAALRMAEARGFLIESVARGYSSKGFHLYKTIAGTGLGETGDAYSAYLFSIFDEFSLDLSALFDRHSIQGRLFPRESALLALLDQINHFEIEHLWVEDETIGWIYQYFNTQEERKKMRAESQAPRNSRELAVRNQFFTPRYVVEFLTDNTLGRIWYEMTQGKTALVDTCRYLVRRPTEIFLEKGEAGPEEDSEDQESLSQEELLKQPVYIPFRPLKDPREIRMLDPACGSMHFGLYAFDLFEKIYGEAWQLETELGPSVFDRSKELLSLQASYSSFEEFQKVIPKLIIEQNVHGVDIDPRAVQIAGLSLWQRAQRAWHNMGINPNQRPAIKKSNIVCAEPMPGEKEMLLEFTARLNPPMLGQLVETIFDKMGLAGEAGTLLKIEEEIKTAISRAKEAFNIEILRRKEEEGYLPGMAPKREPTLFDFADLYGDTDFWETAEERILDALRDYADQAESDEGQKRLFAEDAAKGFAFIDLCRKRFDVVLMNPPYGKPSGVSLAYNRKVYAECWIDLYGSFFLNAIDRVFDNGILGALTSRTFLALPRFKPLREILEFKENRIRILADLGFGVLDGAMVETCASVVEKSVYTNERPSFFVDCRKTATESIDNILQTVFESSENYKLIYKKQFEKIPGKQIAYWVSPNVFNIFNNLSSLEPAYASVGPGLTTLDNERFLRNWWEFKANNESFNRWVPFAKGGDYSPFYYDTNLFLDWGNNGHYLKAFVSEKYGGSPSRFIANSKFYYLQGLTYPRKTVKGFSVRALPEGHIFGETGISIFVTEKKYLLNLLGFLNSKFCSYCLVAQTSSRQWEKGMVASLPISEEILQDQSLKDLTKEAYQYKREQDSLNEESHAFCISKKSTNEIIEYYTKRSDSLIKIQQEIDDRVKEIYSINDKDICIDIRDDEAGKEAINKEDKLSREDVSKIIAGVLVGFKFGRWDILSMINQKDENSCPDPFKALPKCPPMMLTGTDGFAAIKENFSSDYPLNIAWTGITVDDESHLQDIFLGVRSGIEFIWKENAGEFENKLCDSLGVNTLRTYLNRPSAFFSDHLKRYSKSRRQAPIYWPLQTPSCSYTLWIYYHRLTDQTLYTCVNDFVEPKLKTIADDLTGLRNKSTRSSAEERELASLSDLETELKDFRDELLRIAKFWKPNLNDGVQITAAPLWKLFQHRQWQNKLKETWEKLAQGEYDWAHLACSIWPERVLGKCHADRSLAIAHEVEADFWEEIEVPVIGRGKDTGKTKMEWHPRPFTKIQLHELIQQEIKDMKPSH